MKGSLPWKIMLKECKRFALPFPYSPLFLSLSPSIYILSLLPSPLFFIYVPLISLSSLPPSFAPLNNNFIAFQWLGSRLLPYVALYVNLYLHRDKPENVYLLPLPSLHLFQISPLNFLTLLTTCFFFFFLATTMEHVQAPHTRISRYECLRICPTKLCRLRCWKN